MAFFGPDDELVVSGSDDGHVYVWSKPTGALLFWARGDDDVVNCLEPHPFLAATLATSGEEGASRLLGYRHHNTLQLHKARNANANAKHNTNKHAKQQNTTHTHTHTHVHTHIQTGIDDTVKVWTPTAAERRPVPEEAHRVMERNREARARGPERGQLAVPPELLRLLFGQRLRMARAAAARRAGRGGDGGEGGGDGGDEEDEEEDDDEWGGGGGSEDGDDDDGGGADEEGCRVS